MIPLGMMNAGRPLTVLCLGAHADDIEIGAGGTLLQWFEHGVDLSVHWCVLSSNGTRAAEAQASAADFLEAATDRSVSIASFDDGFFPQQGREIKEWLLEVRQRVTPDVIFTHRASDAHQDHRVVQELTWNIFRDHVVLEYEVPKWDGDFGKPNLYVPLAAQCVDRKIALLRKHFGTQRSKDWFDDETFRGLARLRGVECRAPERYAEAFVARKLRLG